jgi:hypothetical protein
MIYFPKISKTKIILLFKFLFIALILSPFILNAKGWKEIKLGNEVIIIRDGESRNKEGQPFA